MLSSVDDTQLAMALLHNLWIVGVVYCGVRIAYALLGEERPHARYVIGLAALIVAVTALPFTYFFLVHEPAPSPTPMQTWPAVETEPATRSDAPPAPATTEVPIVRYTNAPDSFWSSLDVYRIACAGWMLGAALMLVRLLRNIIATNRFHHRCQIIEDNRVRAIFDGIVTELGIGFRVRLLRAGELAQPAALGLFRPSVVLPLSMLTGLDEQLLRAVLLHELLHIRRYDYLFNLLQSLIEAVLFFNPFVWMLGRMVRAERESACDAIAASRLGDSRQYARALLEAASLAVASAAPLAAGLGADDSKGFANRLRRLLRPNAGARIRLPWNGLLGFALLAGVLVAGTLLLTQRGAILTAQLLTPEERVAAIAELQRDAVVVSESIPIHGTIVDEDGVAYTGHITATAFSFDSMNSYGMHAHDGRFQISGIPGGTHLFAITAANYPPSLIDLPETRDVDTPVEVSVKLSRGILNTVRFVDESDNPIFGVEVHGGHRIQPSSYSGTIQLETDEKGEVVLEGFEGMPIALTARKAGFEEAQRNLEVVPGKSHVWKLNYAARVQGIVRDAETGAALKGAAIHLVNRRRVEPGRHSSHHYGISGPVLATSDAAGEFTLDTLRADSLYTFSAHLEGYAVGLLVDVELGEEQVSFELARPLVMTGRIDLPPSVTPARVSLSHWVRVEDDNIVHVSSESDVRDGRFRFEDLFPGVWKLDQTPGLDEFSIDLTESLDGVVLGNTSDYLRVEASFETSAGRPLVNGDIVVKPIFKFPGENHRRVSRVQRFPVTNGRASLEVPSHSVGFYVGVSLADYGGENDGDAVGLPGYFMRDREFTINNGRTESSIVLQLEPAGAVTVLVDDGRGVPVVEPRSIGIIHVVADQERRMSSNELDGVHRRIESGALYSALPLEQTYRFHAEIDGRRVLSPEVRLDARNPIAEVVLTPGKAASLEVTVLDVDRSAAANAQVRLECLVDGHSIGAYRGVTNEQGRVTLENIQPNDDIDFELNGHILDESEKLVAYARVTVSSLQSPATLQLEAVGN